MHTYGNVYGIIAVAAGVAALLCFCLVPLLETLDARRGKRRFLSFAVAGRGRRWLSGEPIAMGDILSDNHLRPPKPTACTMPTAAELRRDALQIWRAGVDAVLPQRLVPRCLRVEGQSLLIGGDVTPLNAIRRIVVVGAGKAGAGMAEAVEAASGRN